MAASSLFLLFILSFITITLASVNIDCGSTLSSVDDNDIKWVGDKDFVTSGESATVSSTTDEKSLATLRYFPIGDSNCYSNIPVTKGGKVLIRTMFYYGNYDGKSSSPSFSVVFEKKHQRTVSISSASELDLLELIFAPASGETSVCFVRTSSSSTPFVSSIEVVDLDDGMYDELRSGEGLFYQQRVAFGTTESLRSDLHGRFWLRSKINVLATGTTSTAASIDTSGASNKPPESILHHSWTGEGLKIFVDSTLPSKGVPVYLAMYFSEPLQFSTRSFNILYDDKQVGEGPIVPEFGKTTQVVVRDVVASSTSHLVFQSSTIGVFPPMINAFELYVISTGTNGGDGRNGSNSGSGGNGGGGSESSGSGSGGSGGTSKGGSGGSSEVSSGGSTNGKKKSNLPIILGVVSTVAFLLIAYVLIAIILTNRRKARLQALAIPTSVPNTGTGASPLFGQQMGNDSSQQTDEANTVDIDALIETNQSYIAQRS